MKKKNKHGWYCKICGRFRPNEKFSGKGHAQHICKDCQRQIHEEKLTKKQVLKKEKATTYEQLSPQVESLIKDVDNHVGAWPTCRHFSTLRFSFTSGEGSISSKEKGLNWDLSKVMSPATP